MMFAQKIYKIPEFYMIFARKCPNFTQQLPEKYFPNFRGHVSPLPPPPRLLRLCSADITRHSLPSRPYVGYLAYYNEQYRLDVFAPLCGLEPIAAAISRRKPP